MRRLLLLALGLLAVTAPTAVAADRCPHRPGEQRVARSAQATVVAKLSASRQTLIGCSRASGRRRTIDVLSREDGNGLVGLRLAGTRVAYFRWVKLPYYAPQLTLFADDAVSGGRRHQLSGGDGSYGSQSYTLPDHVVWTVDAQGDVAWLARVVFLIAHDDAVDPPPVLLAWRPGSGARQVDARAHLTEPQLIDGLLRWRRDGALRSVDLATLPPSACPPGQTTGTLAVDMIGTRSVCSRATGRVRDMPFSSYGLDLLDANGPYVVYRWLVHTHAGAFLYDADADTTTAIDATPPDLTDASYGHVADAVVTDHGALAWIVDGALWVRDATGTRRVPGTGTGPLLRDGSTVTWSGGGPTVTLNP